MRWVHDWMNYRETSAGRPIPAANFVIAASWLGAAACQIQESGLVTETILSAKTYTTDLRELSR